MLSAVPSDDAFQGPRQGRLPNIYWRAISWEALRGRRRRSSSSSSREEQGRSGFAGLPPEESISLDHGSAWRVLRQSSPMWAEVHKGAISSGRIADVLGFYEPEIAQRLSLPRGHWNRSSFPSALRNLNDYTCTAHSLAHSSESVEETLLKVLWSPDGTREPWAIDDEADDEEKEEEELGHAAAAVALDRAKSGASSVAGQGIRGVRCRWGRVQEPSFLLRLEEILPESYRISEVGFCMLTPAQVQQLGFSPEMYAKLPPMGASPDAMLWAFKDRWSLAACVEIKSLCPFQVARTSRRGGKGSERFGLGDRLSSWKVTPQIVAQCQLQMLCTDTKSTIIAARSLSGIKIFRMRRDDDYLRALLRLSSQLQGTAQLDRDDVLSRLVGWSEGRCRPKGKGRDKDKGIRSYNEFIQATRAIAGRVNRDDWCKDDDPHPELPNFVARSWSDNVNASADAYLSPKPDFLFLD